VTAYADVLARLVPARRFGIVLGLERMRALLDRLGAPDRALGTIVHVAGTNGKGSTVALIAALTAAGGARVATYTSPHLSTLRERIVIDGALITEEAFVAAAEQVAAAGGDELTFFEQVTAIAMVAIAAANVDVTVLEVGLGGRLDATNVVDAAIGVVTGVALDHEAILGNTIEAIATEKAGIFKPGRAAIIGASGEPAAVPVLAAIARSVGAHAMVIDDASVAAVPPVALGGAHQRRNAAAALAAIDQLESLGVVHVGAPARQRALAEVRHPGRFEILEVDEGAQRLILDGAHNPHGALALATALRERGEHPALILSVSADKDARAIAAALAPVVSEVIVTRYQQERAMEPELLATIVRGVTAQRVTTAPDLVAALAQARAFASVVIAGSLFLIGEARTLLLGAPTDPVRVTDPSAVRPR
jgi:dihydrofolate synthase/folylpolyglutamate synthase